MIPNQYRLKLRSIVFFLSIFSVAFTYAKTKSFQLGDTIDNVFYFKGRMDDLNDIAIVIIKDSIRSTATITILRSGVKTSFEGAFWDNKFNFKEKNNPTSSTFSGKINNSELTGVWIFENQNSMSIIARKTNKVWTIPTNCADNKWLKTFRGSINYSEATLTIQKLAENKISGVLYLDKENRSYKINGDIEEKYLKLTIKDNIGNTIGKLEGSFNDHNNLKFKFWNEQQNESFAVFEQTKHFQYGCIEFVDKNLSYDATYPKLQNEKFNIWLENNIQQWLMNTRKKLIEATEDKHASHSAQAWCEIFAITDDYISGNLTSYESETNNYQTSSFNFGLKKSKPILLKDIFQNNEKSIVDLKITIKNALYPQLSKSDKELRDWVSKEEFENFAFQKEGILFFTNFNPIYNRISYLVSYESINDKLNVFGKELFLKK